MAASRTSDWLVPAGLVALGLIPAAAGAMRLVGLASATGITPENARFVGSPVPIALHVVAVVTFSFLGAFQFAAGFRGRHPRWHRVAGRILVPAGLVAALTGLWMSQAYALPATDGTLLYVMRLAVGLAMVAALALGLAAILRRDFSAHRAWMMRAYGLGMGAGTQVLTGLPWILLVGPPDRPTRALLLGAGWLINVVLVEWLLARGRTRLAS